MPEEDRPGLQKLLDYCSLLSSRNGLNFFYDFQLKKHARERCGVFVPDDADYEYVTKKADFFYNLQASGEMSIRQLLDVYADKLAKHQYDDVLRDALYNFNETGDLSSTLSFYAKVLYTYSMENSGQKPQDITIQKEQIQTKVQSESSFLSNIKNQLSHIDHRFTITFTFAVFLIIMMDSFIYAFGTTDFAKNFIAAIASNIINIARLFLLVLSIYLGCLAYKYISTKRPRLAALCGITIGIVSIIGTLEGSIAVKRWGELHIPGFAKIEIERSDALLYADY